MIKLSPHQGKIRSLFSIPGFSSNYDNQVARILYTAIWVASIGNGLTALVAALTGYRLPLLIPFIASSQVNLFTAYILLKKKRLRISIWWMALNLWVFFTAEMVLSPNLTTLGAMGQFIIVFFFSFIIRGNAGLSLAFFSIGVDFLMYKSRLAGWLPSTGLETDPALNLFGMLVFTALAGLLGTQANRRLLMAISESEQNAQRFQAVFEQSHNAIFIVDLDGIILNVNSQACNYLKLPREKIVGHSILLFAPQKDREQLEELAAELHQRGEVGNLELEYHLEGGVPVFVDVFVKLVNTQEGLPDHVQVIVNNITHQKQTQQRILEIAFQDSLTGVENRFSFEYRMNTTLAQFSRMGQGNMVLFYFDIDDFKTINDTYGHNFGDKVLQAFARRLISATRSQDFIARIGGDEFVVALENLSGAYLLEKTSTRLFTALNQPFHIEGEIIYMHTSMGVSQYPQDGSDLETLLKVADADMYLKKQNKTNKLT